MCKTIESPEQPAQFNEYTPPPRQIAPQQTVTIFDWDDTILCTSFLRSRSDATDAVNLNLELPDVFWKQLQRVEATAISLLEQAKMVSDSVFIVTNASPGWVEHSCSLYLPTLRKSLEGISITSAKGEHERNFPGDAVAWKTQAFMEICGKLCISPTASANVIVLGDSFAEMQAAEAIGYNLHEASVKTIKFVENPSIAELQAARARGREV